MTFTFGLGSNNMQQQFQQDPTSFKLADMSSNLDKYRQLANPDTASSFLDYTSSYLNVLMQQDQKNDNNTVFLFEYQALLRSRIQQLITDLTAALTRDLDAALEGTRKAWDDRSAAQGFSGVLQDAGAARVAYNFMTGFAQGVNPAGGSVTSEPYVGVEHYDGVSRVTPDASADAIFFRSLGAGNGDEATVRVFGTATIQQSFHMEAETEGLIDSLEVNHGGNTVAYREVGGGFISHQNRYRFIDVENTSPTPSIPNYRSNAQNIVYTNNNLPQNVAGNDTGNMNNLDWVNETQSYEAFNATGRAKNHFQKVLYDAIYEMDQRNILRDIFRLSEKNGFFSDMQVASTSSLPSGSQAQASVFLNFVPENADRPDLGGRINLSIDRFSAFYHC